MFGLQLDVNKTEIMISSNTQCVDTIILASMPLQNVTHYKYLSRKVSPDGSMDPEIDMKLAAASTSFEALWRRLWSSHDVKTEKIQVYIAVIMTVLLYGAKM